MLAGRDEVALFDRIATFSPFLSRALSLPARFPGGAWEWEWECLGSDTPGGAWLGGAPGHRSRHKAVVVA